MILKFCFSGADGIMAIHETLTAGMVGKKVNFEFTKEWEGLTKTAVYMAGDVIRAESCDAGENEIPADVLALPGRLYVGIYGESADGELVIPTILAKGPTIQPGADPLKAPVDPEPVSAYSRLLAQIGDLGGLETEDKSSLVAAINEVAKTGGNGSDSSQNGNGVWVGETPPEDTSLLWVDPSDDTEDGNDYVLTDADKTEIAEMAAELVDVPSAGVSEEVWELLADITLEEETQKIKQTWAGNPMRKVMINVYSPAASADTNYMPTQFFTADDASGTFYTMRVYPTPLPKKSEQNVTYIAEAFKLGEDAVIRFTEYEVGVLPRGNKIAPIGSVSSAASFGNDIYSDAVKDQITGVDIQSYKTFLVGTRFTIWGVAK